MSPNRRTSSSSRVRTGWRTDTSRLAAAQWVRRRNKPVNVRNDNANRRIEVTANTTTSTRPVAAGAVAQHDCADRGCLAVMLGLALGDATASNAGEGSSLSW